MENKNFELYTKILEEELIKALGCTEPITIAYATALVRKYMENDAESITIYASPNMIKNSKSVVIPNTNGAKGMRAGAIVSYLGGNAEKVMEVLDDITDENIEEMNRLLKTDFCEINKIDNGITLQIIIVGENKNEKVEVEIAHSHTNVVRIERNGENLLKGVVKQDLTFKETDKSILNIDDIYEYATTAPIELFEKLIDDQLLNNKNIADEGLIDDYGTMTGKILMKHAVSLQDKVRAYATAGSDARMGGCTSPVTILSGSGNQGITAANPLTYYCKEKNIDKDRTRRALVLADLVGLRIKYELTRLSAYCGVVCASCGVGCAFTYLEGGSLEQVKMTIKNMLSGISGMICDGAKESCAIKIAAAIDSAFVAHYLAMDNVCVSHGCGIIHEDVEETIKNVGVLGRVGMKETDNVILDIMLGIKS